MPSEERDQRSHMKNVNLCTDVCNGRPIVGMWRKLEHCNFLRHYKSDECQTLHDGSTHWALPAHAIFSDLDSISRSQQCQTALTEHFMFQSD